MAEDKVDFLVNMNILETAVKMDMDEEEVLRIVGEFIRAMVAYSKEFEYDPRTADKKATEKLIVVCSQIVYNKLEGKYTLIKICEVVETFTNSVSNTREKEGVK